MVKKMNYSRIKTLNIFTVLCYAEDGLRECIYKKKMITYILNFKDHGKRDIFFESEVILFLNELPDIVINDLLNYVNINENKELSKWMYSDNIYNDEYFLNYQKNKQETDKRLKQYLLK